MVAFELINWRAINNTGSVSRMSLQRRISVCLYCWCFCCSISTCSILSGRTIDYELVYLFLSLSAPSLSLEISLSPRPKSRLTLTNIGLFLVGGNEYNRHSHPATDLNFWSAVVGTPDLDWSWNLRCFSNDDGRRHRHYATAICYPSHKNILRFLCFWVCLRIWKIKDRKAMLPLASMLLSMLPSNVYCCFFKEMLQKDNLLDSITRRAG